MTMIELEHKIFVEIIWQEVWVFHHFFKILNFGPFRIRTLLSPVCVKSGMCCVIVDGYSLALFRAQM